MIDVRQCAGTVVPPAHSALERCSRARPPCQTTSYLQVMQVLPQIKSWLVADIGPRHVCDLPPWEPVEGVAAVSHMKSRQPGPASANLNNQFFLWMTAQHHMRQRKLLEPVPLCIGFPTKSACFRSAPASAVGCRHVSVATLWE